MTDKLEKQTKIDVQPAYDPPQALRMGGMHTGEGGAACADGSGFDGACNSGTGASNWCFQVGNSAAVGCDTSGNTPVGECNTSGMSATLMCNSAGNGFA
jgi:hypothetical protein